MENLHALDVTDVLVTPDLLLVLPQLRQLKSVHMSGVQVAENCDAEQFERLKVLKLTTLRLFGPHSEGYAKLAQAFDYTQLTILDTDLPGPIHKIETSECSLPLRNLTVVFTSPNLKVTSSFFRNLPELRKFHYRPAAEDVFMDLSLDSSYIPHLEDICCSWRQLANFIPGRRIGNIEILHSTDGPWPRDWFAPLLQSSRRFKRLMLSCDAFIQFPHGRATYLANVDHLELEFSKSYTSSSRMPEESPHDQVLHPLSIS
jgi:hypothetical protein